MGYHMGQGQGGVGGESPPVMCICIGSYGAIRVFSSPKMQERPTENTRISAKKTGRPAAGQ
jgi:hypothetical protein